MRDCIDNAVEELKRVDHSIFVSLKYTRTVDILGNILIRMIDCYDFLFEGLLKYALEHKMISSIPSTPKEKCVLIKQIFKEQEIHNNVDLYLLLKAIAKTKFTKENEYRRHVALRTIVAGRDEIININIVSQYYEIQTAFFHLVDKLCKGEYLLGSGILITDEKAANEKIDEENPENPYWEKVKAMKDEAEAEIAHEKIIREKIRHEKSIKEQARQKEWEKRRDKEKAKEDKKIHRKTKRIPKIKPKRVVSKNKLKEMKMKIKSKNKKTAKKSKSGNKKK